MRKYIVSMPALLLGVLASPGYCTTVILNFDANFNGPNGVPCSTTVSPFSCMGVTGPGAPLSPPGSPAQSDTTLVKFGNIVFNEVTVTGDPAINGGAATAFSFTSTGSDFAYNVGTQTLTNTGTINGGILNNISAVVTDASPTVVATIGGGFAPVYFSNGTVTLNSALLTALGFNAASYQASLGSDGSSTTGDRCDYPEGARDPQTGGPLAGLYAGGCAVGYPADNPGNLNVESQYLEVVITSTPEPTSSLLLGFGLVAVGSLARKRHRRI